MKSVRDVENIKQWRNSLANSTVSPKERHSRKVIANNTQNTEEYHCVAFQEKCMLNALKGNVIKYCSRIQIGGWTLRFSSRSQHHADQIFTHFTLKQILEKSWEYGIARGTASGGTPRGGLFDGVIACYIYPLLRIATSDLYWLIY